MAVAAVPVRRMARSRPFDGDRVTGVIDYGAMKIDHPAVDVARLLGSLVEDDLAGWAMGLAAYREVRPLSADEAELARALDVTGTIAAAAVWLRLAVSRPEGVRGPGGGGAAAGEHRGAVTFSPLTPLESERGPGYDDGKGRSAMPLRDHFRPPLDDFMSWEGFHGQWPAMIVTGSEPQAPAALRRRTACPSRALHGDRRIGLRQGRTPTAFAARRAGDGNGGVATAVWAPPRPTFDVATDLPDQDEYEVRVYDTKRHRRLVAAVEIVSPANKDRPETPPCVRAKCAALLQERVSVAIVDLVTTRQFNLYGDLLELIGETDPCSGAGAAPAVCRRLPLDEAGTTPGFSRPGPIPSPSASRCRRCPCGWPTTSPCPWNWKRATRRPAASCRIP